MITEKLWGQLRIFRKKQKIWEPSSLFALTLSDGEMGYVTYDTICNIVNLYVGEKQLQGYLHWQKREQQLEDRYHWDAVMDDCEEDRTGMVAFFGRRELLTDAEIEENKVWFRNAHSHPCGKDPYPVVRENVPYYLPMEVTDERKLHRMEEVLDAVLFLSAQDRWDLLRESCWELLSSDVQLLHLKLRPDGSGYEVDRILISKFSPRPLLVSRPLTDEELSPVRGLPHTGRWDMQMVHSVPEQMLSAGVHLFGAYSYTLGAYVHGIPLWMDAEVAREEVAGWIPLDHLRIPDYVHQPEKLLLGLTQGFSDLGLLPQQLVIDRDDERLGAILPSWCESLDVKLVRSEYLPGLKSWNEYCQYGGRDTDLFLQGSDWEEALEQAFRNGSAVLSISAGKDCCRDLQMNLCSDLSEAALAIRRAFGLKEKAEDEAFDLEPDWMEAWPAEKVPAMQEDSLFSPRHVAMERLTLADITLEQERPFYYLCQMDGRRYTFKCRTLRWEEKEVEAPKVLRRRGKLD